MIVPDGVTMIPSKMFKGASYLEEIVLPDTLVSIGFNAFSGCSSLTSLDWLPDGLITVGPGAFSGCSGLQTANLPDTVTDIGRYAFKGCTSLTAFHYPLSWTNVSNSGALGHDYDMFKGDILLKRIEIPEGVSKVPANAFNGSEYLEEIVFPDTLVTVGSSAFINCKALNNLVCGSGLKVIESSAFEGCISITNLDWLPDGFTKISPSAFTGCSGLQTANLPDTVTEIGRYAFKGCTSLTAFHYPLSWTSVPNSGSTGHDYDVFKGDTLLKQIEVPEGVSRIPSNAFNGSEYLEKIVFPDTLVTVGSSAFMNCAALNNPACGSGLKVIESNAFQGCISLTNLDWLPDGFTTINPSAFTGCSGLQTANLPDTVTEIGRYAFKGCTSLTAFHYPLSWTTVSWDYVTGKNYDMFLGDTLLNHIVIPEGVSTVPSNAFYAADGLTEVQTPASLCAVGKNAFIDCTALEKIYLSPDVVSIGENAFENCPNLITWCELGSYAYRYMVDNGVNYYYLTPEGLAIPSGNIYEGEGALYGTAHAACSFDESVVLTEIQATIWQNGEVYRRKTVYPNTTDYSLTDEIHTALALYNLPLGDYRYTLTAKTPWSSETWADSTFSIVEKVPVFSFRETDGNPCFVAAEEIFQITGEISCNFDITQIGIVLRHNDTHTDTEHFINVRKPNKVITFWLKGINAADFQAGEYSVYIAARCDDTGDEWHLVHDFDMIVSNGSTIDSELRQRILTFVDNDTDPWSFSEYSVKLGDYLCKMNFWDQVCIAWSDFTGETRSSLQDLMTGKEYNTYQKELIKADIADLLRDMFDRDEFPDAESTRPEWLKQLIKDAKDSSGLFKAAFSVGDDELAKLREKYKIDKTNWEASGLANDVFVKDLKTFDTCMNFFSTVGKGLSAMGKTVKFGQAMMNAICELYTDHYRDLEMLRMLYESNQGDAEFRQAILELTEDYSSRQDASMAQLTTVINKYLEGLIWDEMEEVVLDLASEAAGSYVALGKVCAELLFKLTGLTDHGENWQEFYHRFSSQKVIAQLYYQSVWDIKVAISNDKSVPDRMIEKVQSLFVATRTATARCFDTLAKLDKKNKGKYEANAALVRTKTMPGISAEIQ